MKLKKTHFNNFCMSNTAMYLLPCLALILLLLRTMHDNVETPIHSDHHTSVNTGHGFSFEPNELCVTICNNVCLSVTHHLETALS